MSAAITWNRYGKSRVRLVKIRRAADRHDVLDLTVDIALEGAFEAVYTDGDNSSCLATDTMKNTVYAFARRDPIDHVETFASRLAEYFAGKPGVSLVRIDAAEHPWDSPVSRSGVRIRMRLSGTGMRNGRHRVTDAAGKAMRDLGPARPRRPQDGRLGVRRLSARRIHDAARHDRPPARDVDHRRAGSTRQAFRISRRATRIRTALVETFASHRSESVQHTLYAMGEAALSACRRRDRDSAGDAQPPPFARRSLAVRPRQPE